MSSLIVYIDRSAIREGKLEEVRTALRGLVEFVDSAEPQLLACSFYIDEDGVGLTCVAIHRDSSSLDQQPVPPRWGGLLWCPAGRSAISAARAAVATRRAGNSPLCTGLCCARHDGPALLDLIGRAHKDLVDRHVFGLAERVDDRLGDVLGS